MSRGRPFFVLNDDRGNPINQAADQLINSSAASGKTKGDSRSIDPLTGKKYPRGFTPQVDYYVDQTPILNAKLDMDVQNGGLNLKLAGTNPLTGRPIEYGASLTVDTENGIKIKKSGDKSVTNMSEPVPPFTGRHPVLDINLEALTSGNRYFDKDSISTETNLPTEYGNRIVKGIRDNLDQTDRLGFNLNKPLETEQEQGKRYRTYNYYNDYKSKNFVHLLDFFINQNGDYVIPKIKAVGLIDEKMSTLGQISKDSITPLVKPWLGGQFFYKTYEDNEDPTILGVDIKLKKGGSPLFNGNLKQFLEAFGKTYKELETRKDIYDKFVQQILKFIEIDEKSLYKGTQQKSYYLQNIKGLEKLVERDGGSDAGYFIDFGKDLITLEFLEDVSQNMGYLSALYKTLAYSRINGKQLIPRNLLKFDVDITITEIRNYQRQILSTQDKEKTLIFADKISKYTYTLYECSFIFDKLPHGDAVNNDKIEILPNFPLTFDYKFSTMNFTKYTGKFQLDQKENGLMEYYSIDNKLKDLSLAMSKDFEKEGPLKLNAEKTAYEPRFSPLENTNAYPNIPKALALVFEPPEVVLDPNESLDSLVFETEEQRLEREQNQNVLSETKQIEKDKESEEKSIPKNSRFKERLKLGAEKAFDQIKSGLKRAAVNEVNRQIFTQAALLNKTIDNIRNSVPYAGRMSEPTNVYTGTNAFRNDVINTLRNSVGAAVKGFFSKP